jgi:hypothetical protein
MHGMAIYRVRELGRREKGKKEGQRFAGQTKMTYAKQPSWLQTGVRKVQIVCNYIPGNHLEKWRPGKDNSTFNIL